VAKIIFKGCGNDLDGDDVSKSKMFSNLVF
jgi:hypothetical protein